jgi:hypothetical protein
MHHKNMASIAREHDLSPSSSSINHVRVQASLDREHNQSISFTLYRGRTLSPQVA